MVTCRSMAFADSGLACFRCVHSIADQLQFCAAKPPTRSFRDENRPMAGRLASNLPEGCGSSLSSRRMDANEGIRITRGVLGGFTVPSFDVADSIIDTPARVNTRRPFAFPMPPAERPVSDAHHLCRLKAVHPTMLRQHFPAELLKEE